MSEEETKKIEHTPAKKAPQNKTISYVLFGIGGLLLIIALIMATVKVTTPSVAGIDYDCGSVLSPKSSGTAGKVMDSLMGAFGQGGVSKDATCGDPIGGQRTLVIILAILGVGALIGGGVTLKKKA